MFKELSNAVYNTLQQFASKYIWATILTIWYGYAWKPQNTADHHRPPQTAPQTTPGLPGKPQTTAEHTAEHGRTGSKTAEQQCMLNYRR